MPPPPRWGAALASRSGTAWPPPHLPRGPMEAPGPGAGPPAAQSCPRETLPPLPHPQTHSSLHFAPKSTNPAARTRRPARYRSARHSEGQRRRGLMELPGQPASAPRPSPRPTSPAAARAARAPGPAAAQAAPLPAGGSPVIPRLRARQTAPPLSPAPLRAAALCP